jgi:hypothetical protein
MNLEIGPMLWQPGEELPQFDRCAVVGLVIEADARVEIPPDQQKLLLSAQHCLSRNAEIARRVDEHSGPVSLFDPPAIAAKI